MLILLAFIMEQAVMTKERDIKVKSFVRGGRNICFSIDRDGNAIRPKGGKRFLPGPPVDDVSNSKGRKFRGKKTSDRLLAEWIMRLQVRDYLMHEPLHLLDRKTKRPPSLKALLRYSRETNVIPEPFEGERDVEARSRKARRKAGSVRPLLTQTNEPPLPPSVPPYLVVEGPAYRARRNARSREGSREDLNRGRRAPNNSERNDALNAGVLDLRRAAKENERRITALSAGEHRRGRKGQRPHPENQRIIRDLKDCEGKKGGYCNNSACAHCSQLSKARKTAETIAFLGDQGTLGILSIHFPFIPHIASSSAFVFENPLVPAPSSWIATPVSLDRLTIKEMRDRTRWLPDLLLGAPPIVGRVEIAIQRISGIYLGLPHAHMVGEIQTLRYITRILQQEISRFPHSLTSWQGIGKGKWVHVQKINQGEETKAISYIYKCLTNSPGMGKTFPNKVHSPLCRWMDLGGLGGLDVSIACKWHGAHLKNRNGAWLGGEHWGDPELWRC